MAEMSFDKKNVKSTQNYKTHSYDKMFFSKILKIIFMSFIIKKKIVELISVLTIFYFHNPTNRMSDA